jgi:hypothetical protein
MLAVLLTEGFEAYKRASELEPTNPLLLIKQGQMKRLLADAKNGETNAAEQKALYEEARERSLLKLLPRRSRIWPPRITISR